MTPDNGASKTIYPFRDTFEDILLGSPGDPVAPVVEEFNRRGVAISPGAVSNLKRVLPSGGGSGETMRRRLRAARILEADDASQKDGLYFSIAAEFLRERTKKLDSTNGGGYLSSGLTLVVAEKTAISPQMIRLALRSMRADLILCEQQGILTEPLLRLFYDELEQYRDDFPGPKKVLGDLDNDSRYFLEGSIVEKFYRSIYSPSTGVRVRYVASWASYEASVMAQFYNFRLREGSHFSPLDHISFESFTSGHSTSKVAKEIEEKTGVDFNRSTLWAHRNSLLFGSSSPSNS